MRMRGAGTTDARRLLTACFAVFVLPAHAEPIAFQWFEYTGRDAAYAASIAPGHYTNPILSGFHPDPSIARAGDRFYLVHSTFAYFPGIPVFESEDLVHWKQVGNVIERPTQLDYATLGVSRGVFAPSIEYQDGLFYVFNTHVDGGGNYVVTAKNPSGPWSDPVWLPELVDGIDPSMFVDDDGRAYVLNNGPPQGAPLYDGHRAIWMQAFDRKRLRLFGPRRVLVNGGVDLSKKPIWIEGPHIYKRHGWYYLSCAEGGTGPQHSQVVLRARSVWGPFTPYDGNPILTQRDLPQDRPNAVTNAGHADLVEAPDGSWWATFLATRTYEGVHYNTGRETFLLPVQWRDGWPVILEAGAVIPHVARGPKFMRPGDQAPLSGNFTWRDEFDRKQLDLAWLQLRTPQRAWFDLQGTPGVLTLEPQPLRLDAGGNPSFLGRRQQHLAFDASVQMTPPRSAGVQAGVAVFQNESHWFFLGVRRDGADIQVFLERKHGAGATVVASVAIEPKGDLQLKVSGRERSYSFYYALENGAWTPVATGEDGSILSTAVAGGFVGATIGPHARITGPEAER